MTVPRPQVIHTADAPKAIGPYSQALQVKGLLFTAGQIGLHPETGQLVEGGIEAQTRRVLRNLEAVLAAGGSSLAEVVKTTVFMADLGEFGRMNAIYAESFPAVSPARSTVQVAALPKGARVEIECIATLKD